MKSRITEELKGEFLCTVEIQKLYNYDKEHDTDYLHTLKSYVNNHLNAIKAAGELYIHRTTVNYRLERIKEITGLDLKNLDSDLLFIMSLNLIGKE